MSDAFLTLPASAATSGVWSLTVTTPTKGFFLFEVQIDSAAVTQLQFNAQLVATAGSATTKLSKHSLGSIATTNTHEVKLLGLYDDGVNIVGTNARVIVTCNQSQIQDQIAGV